MKRLSGERKAMAVDNPRSRPGMLFRERGGAAISRAKLNQRQLGSQICMFHVDCEIGRPVRIGYIHVKFVITSAT